MLKRVALTILFLLISAASGFATQVTIQAGVVDQYHGPLTPTVARLEADREFSSSEGRRIPAGTGYNGFGQQFSVSVDGSGNITIAQGLAYATDDSSDPRASYTLAIYDAFGRLIRRLYAQHPLHVTHTISPTTWDTIRSFSETTPVLPLPSLAIVDQHIATATSGILPTQTGNNGKVLTTSGSVASWGTELPSQGGNNGKYLTTNGSATSWATVSSGSSLFGSGFPSLAAAVASIGSTKTLLTIDQDLSCSTTTTVPATLVLRFTNQSQLLKSTGCTITFLGVGLADPLSQFQVFSGFAAGDITFTGTAYPEDLSAELWGTSATAVQNKYALADAALVGKRATIHVLTGSISGQSIVTQYHTIAFGPGDFLNTAASGPSFVMQSNTRFTGAGKGMTTVRESSSPNAQAIQIVYGSGAVTYPFTGSISSVEVDHIRFYGPADVPFDTTASAVYLGNVIGGSIHDNDFDSVHGFGAYVGAFADPTNTGSPHYAENSEIYNNTFENLGVQQAGVIQGRNCSVHHNKFLHIGRIVKLVTDGVTNSTTTVTSATANFPSFYVGSTITIVKAGQDPITTSIFSVTNSTTIVLSGTVPYTTTGVTIKVHNPFQSVIDLEPNDPHDILENISVHDNIIDARDAVYSANCIAAQIGGALSTKNLRIERNDCIGADVPLTDAILPTQNISIGISLVGGDGVIVANNNIRGTAQSGVSITNTVRSFVTGNNLSIVGGGGNPAIQVQGSGNNVISNNPIRVIGAGTQDSGVTETEYTGNVDVAASDGTNSVVTRNSADTFFYPHNIREDVVIGGTTYLISDWIDIGTFKIARTSGGALTSQTLTTRYNANTYFNTGPVTKTGNSFSTVLVPTAQLGFDLATVGNTAGVNTTLKSTPTATTSQPNETVYYRFAGRFAANADADKRVRVDISGTRFDTGTLALNDKAWILDIQWTYTAGSNQNIVFRFLSDGTTKTETVDLGAFNGSSFTMLLQGSGTSANDVTCSLMQVWK